MSARGSPSVAPARICFLDYLRDLMILQVVMWHSGAIYGPRLQHRWLFQDPQTSVLFDAMAFITELYLVPVIFFVAGWFALPSIRKHGPRRFLLDKTKRLGIPFVLGVIFLIPTNFYINRLAHGMTHQGYFAYWFTTYFTEDIGPAHLWFLYVLYFFFLLFAAGWALARRWGMSGASTARQGAEAAALPGSSTGLLIGFGLLSVLPVAAVSLGVGYGAWVTPLGCRILPFQPSRCAIDLCYFFFGVYAGAKGRLFSEATRLKTLAWFLVAVAVSVGFMQFRVGYGKLVEASTALIVWNAAFHCVTALSAFATLAMALRLWLNRPSRALHVFTRNSYTVYIIHQPLVVFLEYLLLGLRLSCYLKFAVVFGVGFSGSLLASHFVLRRIPGLKNVL
jgi:peptidoglycan/LPS O-acetylase OafA/YrhL